jgi:chemotaxis protein MotB
MPFRKNAKELEVIHEAAHHFEEGHGEAGGGHDDESNWLVSYADMMTLLCGFFIMLFSMAKLDEPQYERVREALSKQFGGEFQSPAQEAARFMTQFIEQAGLQQDTEIRAEAVGLSIIFRSRVFFDSLSAEVRPEGLDILNKLIGAIRKREEMEGKKFRVVIEGHTDGRPVIGGAFPSNWELSGARAARVVRAFLSQGFAASDLVAIGYGDTRPELQHRNVDGSYNEEALGKNRRVVIRILKQDATMIPMPDAPSEPRDLTRIPAQEANEVKAEGQQLRTVTSEAAPAAPTETSVPTTPAGAPTANPAASGISK